MALTKVSRGLLSTGIVDNSNATAITINADESVTLAGALTGTSAAFTDVVSVSNANSRLRLFETDTTNLNTQLQSQGGDFKISTLTDDSSSATLRLLIDHASGNVGIGTSSPTSIQGFAKVLKVEDSSNASIVVSGGAHEAEYAVSSGGGWFGTATNIPQRFVTNNTEVFRLTAARDMYFGQTSGSAASVGHIMQANGALYNTANGTTVQYLRRLNTDGAIVQFNRDGTVVGNISTWGGNIAVGRVNCALLFNDDNNRIIPASVASNGARDNVIDLGDPSHRFNDVWIGGGVHLGGTGSANKLASYEEGSFTATLASTAVAPTVNEGNGFTAFYTKVGRKVTINGYSGGRTIAAIGTGIVKIAGLPFANKSGCYAVVSLGHNNMFTTFNGYVESGSTFWYPIVEGTGSGTVYPTGAKYFMFSATYFTG